MILLYIDIGARSGGESLEQIGSLIHVYVVVATFFHNQYLIAPVAVVGVVDVGFNLINHLVGFLLVEHRQAAYAYVNRFGSDVKTCVVAESSEEVVGNVCGDDVVAIAALESEQIVFAKLFAELTIVEITAAEEQKVL